MGASGLWASTASGGTPPARNLALTTRDLDQARDHISRIFADHRLAPEGRARAVDFRHHHAALADLSFNGLQYGASVTVDAPALTDFYLLQFTLRGECEIVCGARAVTLRRGSLLVMNPVRPYRKRWSADCRQLIVRIEKTLLQRRLAAALGRAPAQTLEFDFAPVDAGGRGAMLSRFAEMICRDLDGERMVARPHVQPPVAETLCALLLATIDHNYREAIARPASPAAPRSVRRAEEFMRAHAAADLTLDRIAAAAGVSARTLHRGFRSFRATTPMAQLKTVRLDLARDALSHGRAATVTEIAAACGLDHLGKFARDYRRRYGETPSQTLRQGRW
ncbi:MAG: AraC family transcriptional regulator [Proteobacteria bacterium]|nr:AraC family transcriptional regulator [Pseudomonadota bacterium]